VKNIAEPVRAYRINTVKAAEDKPSLPLPDKPSIAVLPFTNISGDPEQEYFADGMVEEIITALSRVKWFFVIARNSSFTFKGRAVDIKQVGRELGVRYVLEGSVRKAGNRVRITGQLIDAITCRHVWADRFEGGIEDVFDLQDRITESIVGVIEPNVLLAEIGRAKAKPTGSLDAYDLYLRSLPFRYSGKLAQPSVMRCASCSAGKSVEARERLRECVWRGRPWRQTPTIRLHCLRRATLCRTWRMTTNEGYQRLTEPCRRIPTPPKPCIGAAGSGVTSVPPTRQSIIFDGPSGSVLWTRIYPGSIMVSASPISCSASMERP
jgi:TolB-like protein